MLLTKEKDLLATFHLKIRSKHSKRLLGMMGRIHLHLIRWELGKLSLQLRNLKLRPRKKKLKKRKKPRKRRKNKRMMIVSQRRTPPKRKMELLRRIPNQLSQKRKGEELFPLSGSQLIIQPLPV